MATTTKLVTYDEWLRMPEVDDAIEEVVNGEIVRMPPPKITHTLVVHRLKQALDRQMDSGAIYVLDTQFGLIVRRQPLTSRVPDIAVFRKSSMVIIDDIPLSARRWLKCCRQRTQGRREAEVARLRESRRSGSLVLPEARTVSPLFENGSCGP
jgi:hypothetical protein